MNDSDVIALFSRSTGIPTQQSTTVISRIGGLTGLRDADATALVEAGLEASQAEQVQALLALASHLNTLPLPERAVITSADDAAKVFRDMAALTQEHLRVLLLDNKRRCVAVETVYIGTVHGTMLRVAEVYRPVMSRNCPAFIIAHNHPSGDPAPSPEDVELTRTLVAAGRILDIALLDHLIIGSGGWVSLKELRLGFD